MDSLNTRGQTIKMVLTIALILASVFLLFGLMFTYLAQINADVRQEIEKRYGNENGPGAELTTQPDASGPPDRARPAVPQAKARTLAVDLDMPANLPRAVRAAARRVLPVRVGFADGRFAFGNAFMVNDRLAVTCAHLLYLASDSAPVSLHVICGPGKSPTTAVPLVGSQVTDAAFLRVTCRSTLARFRLKARPGEKAWVNGLDYDFQKLTAERWIRSGRLAPRRDMAKSAAPCFPEPVIRQLRLHAALFVQHGYRTPEAIGTAAFPGNSGSLVHDGQGRVLGLVFGASCNGYSFYIPSYNLLAVAKRGNLKITDSGLGQTIRGAKARTTTRGASVRKTTCGQNDQKRRKP